MRRILPLAFIAATLLSSCMSKPTVLDRVNNDKPKMVAMVGKEHPTDQNIIEYFKQADVLVIRSGAGGELLGMIDTLAYLDNNPDKMIVIDGECASACTLLLSRPSNVVFTERASFLFHSAYVGRCNRGLYHYDMRPDGNELMMQEFPKEFRGWLRGKNAFGSVDFTRLSPLVAKHYFPNMMVKHKALRSELLEVTFPIDETPVNPHASLKSCKS